MAARASLLLPPLLTLLLFTLCVLSNARNPIFETASRDALLPSTKPTIPRASVTASREAQFEIVHHKGPRYLTLSRDSLRAHSIQKRLRRSETLALHTPARVTTGLNIGNSPYAITVTLGSPPVSHTLVFDTSSDVSWMPCTSESTTYNYFICTSPVCEGLPSRDCRDVFCGYTAAYEDGTYSRGYFSSDTLQLPAGDVLDGFLFGCSWESQGLLNGFNGVFGLGRSNYSLNSQFASKLGNAFSYCLPSDGVATGYLRIGNPKYTPTGYTPMVTDHRAPTLYFVNLVAISVGRKKITIWSAMSETKGTVIDSGTEITRLPPVAYSALRETFRAAMTGYPLAAAFGVMDTCYDFSGNEPVTYPIITFHYEELKLKLPKVGLFYAVNSTMGCLAFAGNSDASQIAIIGSVQQRTMEVTFDNDGRRIGFSHGACS